MMAGVGRGAIIAAIVRKDIREYTRDRFFTIMTVVGIIAYVALFWLLPAGVNETLTIGIHQTGLDAAFDQMVEGEGAGLAVKKYPSSQALKRGLGLKSGEGTGDAEIDIGLDFPPDFLVSMRTGVPTTVKVYVDGGVPPEIRQAMSSMVKEMAFAVAGSDLPVTPLAEDVTILGEDRAGNQVTLRERMRPLYAFLILIMETMALGTLVAGELNSRTVTAVMVTPARISDFLAAKVIVGTLLAFTEAALLMLLIGSYGHAPLITLTALLLGAVLVTGIGLIAGSSGKDFMGMIFYSMLFIVPLMIPAFAVLFPGTASAWVRALPSYGLVSTIVEVNSYGAGWSDVLPDLASLMAWCAAVFVVGWFTLKRKVESL